MITDEERRNAAVVRALLEAYGRVPADEWLRAFAPEAIYEEPGGSGRLQDLATLRQALIRQFSPAMGLHFALRELLASGERVVALGEVRYWEGARTRVLHQALIYDLRGGLVRRLQVYSQATA